VRALNLFATGDLVPDRTLLLAVDPAAGRARLAGRGEEPDRLESEDAEFFARVAAAYEELARAEPERVRVLDGAQAENEVLAAALAELDDLI
jgi:dTMP kinase